jgi:hypothetical protein
MSAQIVDLASVRARVAAKVSHGRAQQAEVLAGLEMVPGKEAPARFQFWCGASGRRYVHSIYNLFECPPLGFANYVLVRRDVQGVRRALAIGRAAHTSESLNLADVRQRSAELGANEVHVHLLADSQIQSAEIELDLRGLLAAR